MASGARGSSAKWWTVVVVVVAAKVYLLGTWLVGSDPEAHAKVADSHVAAEHAASAKGGHPLAMRGQADTPVQDKLDVDEAADALHADAPAGDGKQAAPKQKKAATPGDPQGTVSAKTGHGDVEEAPGQVEPPGDVAPGTPSTLAAATPRACLGALAAVEAERSALKTRLRAIDAREAALRVREAAAQKVLARALDLAKGAEARVQGALAKKDEVKRASRERLGKLLSNMKPKEAALVVARLPVGHAVSTLQTMKAQTGARILAQVPAERAAEIGLALLVGQKSPAKKGAPALAEPQKATPPATR